MNADLQRFVREALARGLTRDAIRAALREAGWRSDEIEGALRGWAESDLPVPVPRRRPRLEARDAFLHIVLFATLFTTAYNTGQVLFMLIERWLPDPLHAHEWDRYGSWLRSAVAGLVIAFPVFLFLSRLVGREAARDPAARDSAVRRWLTYLTLVVAALVILGDLIVLVTRMLEGELAPRFLLKVAVVLAIAGTVFGHYLGDVRRDERETGGRGGAGPLARVAVGGVFATILAGLLFSGSPTRERWRQLDEQRIQALGLIVTAVQSYYDDRGFLPDSLGALLMRPQGLSRATLLDPETRAPYEYRSIDSLAYELCVHFRVPASEQDLNRAPSEFWRHGAGRTCFRNQVEKSRQSRP